MSYQNFDQYQNAGNPDGSSGSGAPPQEAQMGGGPPTEQSQTPFQGPISGDGAPPGSNQGAEQKTTLW